MAAFEVISGKVTNQASLTALTMATGDSLTVKNYPASARAFIETVWNQNATAGIFRVRSARLHDNVSGIRGRATTATRSFLPDWAREYVYPQDALIAELSGGGAEVDCLAALLYYDSLPGSDGRIYGLEQILPRIVHVIGHEVACTTSATAGDWPAGTNVGAGAVADNLKANVDYAVLGFEVDAAACVVAIKGPDTGNLRYGCPAPVEMMETREWFMRLANRTGKPWIPVFNAANKGSTLVQVLSTAIGATVNVNVILAELSPGA